MSFGAALTAGLDALALSVPPTARMKLLEYLALMEKWNRIYNLTAVRDPQKMVSHHLLDSLAVAPHVRGDTLLDVGSGAGLPGIPLALARPQTAVTLLESSHKKATFLKQAVIELALANVTVVDERIEAWAAPRRFDFVISRAFSDLGEFVTLAGRHCQAGGTLAAMKGVYPHEELAHVPEPYAVRAVVALAVPGLGAERHLVLIERP